MKEIVPFGRRRGGLVPGDLFRNFFGRDLMDEFFDTGFTDVFNTTAMRADIRETENEFIVEAELPGIKREDVDLNLSDDRLTISARCEESATEDKKNFICRERRFGQFSRTFLLQGIDNEKVSAEYKDGILKVVLPKAKEIRRGRKIELN
jgi:HSP20 family protein